MKNKERQKSKLLDALADLSLEELTELKKWLDSPWANSNKKLPLVLKHLTTNKTIADSTGLDKALLFEKIYPGKTYNNRTLNNLLSACFNQLENFLAHSQLRQENYYQLELRKQFYASRKLQKPYNETLRRQIEMTKKASAGDPADALRLHLLHSEKYYQASEKHRYDNNDFLDNAHQLLDTYYAVEKAKYWHEQRDRSRIIGNVNFKRYDTILMQKLQEMTGLPSLALYKMRLERKGDLDWEQFQQFKKAFLSSFNAFGPVQQQDFFYFTVNDNVLLTKSEGIKAYEELFDLYKFGLTKDLMLVNGQMTFVTFNNILLLASYLDEIQFAIDFTDKYLPKLPGDYRKEASIWSAAHLSFMQGDFEAALVLLADKKFVHPLFQLHGRISQLKCNLEWVLAEPDHYLRFESFCSSTKKYIHRYRHFSAARKASYLVLVRYAGKIACHFIEKSDHNELSLEIEKEKNMLAKEWIKKMLQKLEHSK